MKPDKKKKRILIISTLALVVLILIAIRYVPFNKILRVGAVSESEYLNQADNFSQAPNTLLFDFEVDPASGNTGGLYKGIAHSGSFSSRVFGKNTYSSAIERKVGDVGLENLDAVGLSAWVYIFPTGNEVNASYVFSVNNDMGVNVCWKSISVSGKDLPMGKWFKVSGMFNMEGIELKENYKLQVYFWNNSSCDILVDDLFIVFGGSKPRRGDSARVDMTKGGTFIPKFNYPPFPGIFLSRDEIGNGNSQYLLRNGDQHDGEILPYDTLLTGNFTGNPGKLDELLVIHPGKNSNLYRFTKEKSSFTATAASFPAALVPAMKEGRILAGKFTGGGISRLAVIRGEEIILCSFSPSESSFKIDGQVSSQAIRNGIPFTGSTLLAADVDGDGTSEIIVVSAKGSWVVIRLSSTATTPATVIAAGEETTIPEWAAMKGEGSMTAGRFLTGIDRDVILAVYPSLTLKGYGFSLRKFDPGSRKFIPVYPEKWQFSGKTTGLDTLKPGNRFFVIEQPGGRKILRYNREWRFDLKEITFSDTTFRVIANVDFSGFDLDRNPKYFGILRIIPGNYLIPGVTSLMVTGRNCKTTDETTGRCREFRNLPFLPDAVQVYSFPGQTRK